MLHSAATSSLAVQLLLWPTKPQHVWTTAISSMRSTAMTGPLPPLHSCLL